MLRIIVCGGQGSGKSAIIGRLSGAGLDLKETGAFRRGNGGLSGLALAASDADLALLTIDAAEPDEGIHEQLLALSALGVSRLVLAFTKMDLVGNAAETFDALCRDYADHAAALGLQNIASVPLSDRSGSLDWYGGPSLSVALKSAGDVAGPFRFAVAEADGGAVSGSVAGGVGRIGDQIIVLPGAKSATIASIIGESGPLDEAVTGHTVRLILDGAPAIDPGAMICAAGDRALMSDQFKTRIVWLHDDPLLPSRPYALRTANRTVPVTITDLKYIINPRTLEHEAATMLGRDEIGVCNLALAEPIAFDPGSENGITGGFTIIDNQSGETVAVGAIEFGLYRADNIHWQNLSVDRTARSDLKGQKPAVLWFTGLSGSGKSTIANLVEQKLHFLGRHTYTLDGDNVRHGLNKNLGFTDADRVENIRRVAETSKLMADAGLICLVSFISPFTAERRMARDLMEEGEFIEVFVNTPIEVCEARDPKGLYKKARAGEIKNFTGFDSPYDVPENPELDIPTETTPPEDAADAIIAYLREAGFIRDEAQ